MNEITKSTCVRRDWDTPSLEGPLANETEESPVKFEKPVPGHTSHLCLPHPLSCLRKDFPRLTLSPKSDLDCGQVGISTLQTQTASQVLTSTSRALAITCVSRKKERTTGTEALIALNPHFSPLSLVQAIEVSRLNDSLLTLAALSLIPLNTPMASRCPQN